MDIKVPDMMCGHCVATLEKALAKRGISAAVSLENKTVTVADEEAEQAKAVIVKTGYKVQ